MKIKTLSLLLLPAAGLLVWAAPLRADLITYSYSGSLALSAGGDALGLDSGTFVVDYTVDNTIGPNLNTPGGAVQSSRYDVFSASLTLQGTANDGVFAATSPMGEVELNDALIPVGDSMLFDFTVDFSVAGSSLTFQRTSIQFTSNAVMNGPLPVQFPLFDSSEVAIASTISNLGPQVTDGTSDYTISSATTSAMGAPATIPEPGSLGLLGLALLLCFRRFRV